MIEIEFKGVRKSFGTNEVLRGIDLHIPAGRTFAVIGESGSGKSTLVRCINTLERINAGSIRVGQTVIKPTTVEENGEVLSSGQIAAFRTRVGMVFQNFNLFPHLSGPGKHHRSTHSCLALGERARCYAREAIASTRRT